jgi:peptide deformylase
MIKPIIRDQAFLALKSKSATKNDLAIATDLVDTLRANADRGVGLAANMIGSDKRIIVVAMGIMTVPMINPVITKKSGAYSTMESCLSLTGERPTTRYHEIEVQFYDTKFQKRTQKFSDWIAQIIQHEVDHCNGILI